MAERRAAVDVAIVGLGAAGGVAAHVLTEAGLEVAAIEAGPRLSADDYALDEVRNEVRDWMAQPKAAHEVPTWRSGPEEEAGPAPGPMLMVNAVGGTSIHYEGISMRFLPWNFESRSATIARYGEGAIPTGSTLADWPLTYEDLEPYYEEIERTIGIAGAAARVRGQAVDPAGNFFEAERAAPYPMPLLRRAGYEKLMGEAAGRLGWHPFTAPAAVNSVEYDGRPACTYCGFCQYNGCHCDAKGATSLNVIATAEATGRLRVETEARVLRIDTGDDGLAAGVTFVRDGRECFQPAKVVLVATFTYENSRLLLLSKTKAFPNGLANNAGQVGKHYIAHVTPVVYGRFPGRRLNLFNGIGAQASCVDDWNGDNFDHADLGFVGGGMLTAMHEVMPIAFARRPLPPGVPRWGSGWKSWVKENAQSVGSAVAQFDALPYEYNYLDLDPRVTDPHGLPVIRVNHRLAPNEERGHDFLQGKIHEWMRAAGATETWNYPGFSLEPRHCYGGTRMGEDAESSVVDADGFAHEVPNLCVLGASTFPSAAGHNPTLTVQAHAWRASHHLLDRWGTLGG
ncbi:MAG TPA: GMC family oxidoreductase [Solirubrobacterales bacterium]|nr:GMC family oxidoreductase [Solirubrobacterales bacterium]